MDVSLVTDEISLEPDVPGEVLLDVVNTDDVIDAVEIDLTGLEGVTVDLDSTPTLFPGERRRLPLRVTLPTQAPAGRHRLDVVVRATASEKERQALLHVEVRSRPALRVGANPSVRRGIRSASFPITVANRGNTSLLVRPGEVDLPDGLSVSFDPDEFMLDPWQTKICSAGISGHRRLLGTVREHLVDLRVTAASVTPGHPLLEEELREDVRLTFRQRPVIGHGLVFVILLLLVLAIWGTLGFLGLRTFARTKAPELGRPAGFMLTPGPRDASDVALTTSGQVLSQVDGSPVGGATVLMCSLDASVRLPGLCDPKTATYQTASDGDGHFLLPNTFPAPYEIVFLSAGAARARMTRSVEQQSCRVTGHLPGRPADMTLEVEGLADSSAPTVTVSAEVATYEAQPVETDPPGSTSAPTVAASVPPNCPPVRATVTKPSEGSGPPGRAGTARFDLTAGHLGGRFAARSTDVSDAQPTGKGDEGGDGSFGDGEPGAGFPTKPGADGSWTSVATLKGLLGPASYNLTLTAGGTTMYVCGLRVVPGQKNAYPVTFTGGSAPCHGGSG